MAISSYQLIDILNKHGHVLTGLCPKGVEQSFAGYNFTGNSFQLKEISPEEFIRKPDDSYLADFGNLVTMFFSDTIFFGKFH